MKPAHCGELGGEGFGVSLLQLLDQGLHVGRDYFFRGLVLVGVGALLEDKDHALAQDKEFLAHDRDIRGLIENSMKMWFQ